MCARSGMNDPSWLTSPRNPLTSLMHDGVGNCFIAANFFSSGLIPVSDIMCPANSISFPISNFFREMVMLLFLHRSNTVLVRITRSSSLSAQMIVSSTSFLAHGSPSTIMSDLQHHSSDDAFSPIGALRYLNLPCERRNVVINELLGSRASWKYPCTASNLAKHVVVLGIACKISDMQENGCTGLLTYLFKCV